MRLGRREATGVDRLHDRGLVARRAVAVAGRLRGRPSGVPDAITGPVPADLNRAGGIVVVARLSRECEHRGVVAGVRSPSEVHGRRGIRRRRRRWGTRELPCGERMELPVPWALPEHEALDVQGDAPIRLFLEEGLVVATRDVRPTVSLAQPVPIDLDSEVSTRRPDGNDLSAIRAIGLVAGVALAAVLLRIPGGAVRRLDCIAVQGDVVDLDEGGEDLAGRVRDRARRGERSLERDPARG